MRRLPLFVALLLLVVPAAGAAQVQLLGGGGFARPFGDFGKEAESGWHAMVAMKVGVPAIPVGLRFDGSYHRFAAAVGSSDTGVLGGSGSVVVNLPGVGLVPYLLGGVGQYRVSPDVAGSEPVTDRGVHGAFGVNVGALGFGGFAELRVVSVSTDGGARRFLNATLGLRL